MKNKAKKAKALLDILKDAELVKKVLEVINEVDNDTKKSKVESEIVIVMTTKKATEEITMKSMKNRLANSKYKKTYSDLTKDEKQEIEKLAKQVETTPVIDGFRKFEKKGVAKR